MTVEVLGTVIGTAVQGQIVGMANTPCNTSLTNSSNHSEHGNNSQILLDNKVFNEVRGGVVIIKQKTVSYLINL